MDFQVADHAVGSDTHVVEFQGELDLYTAPDFKQRLQEVIDAGKRFIVVDLTHAPFIDSTGLGVLVTELKRLRRTNGALVLVSSNERMLELFGVTGLDQAIPIYQSRDEALSALART